MVINQYVANLLLAGLVVGGVLTMTGCEKQPDGASKPSFSHKPATTASVANPIANNELQLLASDVMTAKTEQFQPSVTITGTLQPSDHTTVQSTVNAQVQQVLADVGKAVTKGQPLVQLDISDSKNQLAQAQADVSAAQAQAIVANKLAERNKILLDQGFVSQIEYERSMADAIAQREAIKAKQAQLSTAKKMYGDTTINAPTAGIISNRSVNVGQVVAPNQPLMEIIDPNKLEFAANVPSEAQTQLQIGQIVPFNITNHPTSYVGQISRIAPQVDAATRQLTIYVAVKPNQNNSQLRPGMYATGKVDYGQPQVGILVPMSAVVVDAKATTDKTTTDTSTPSLDTGSVLTIGKDQLIHKSPVTILKRYDNNSQYLVAGIAQGSEIIIANLNANDVGKKVVLK